MESNLRPWVEASFREKPRTKICYVAASVESPNLCRSQKTRLNELTAETVRAYIAKRQTHGLKVTSMNRELQILRRILHLAAEWGCVDSPLKSRCAGCDGCEKRRTIKPTTEPVPR